MRNYGWREAMLNKEKKTYKRNTKKANNLTFVMYNRYY